MQKALIIFNNGRQFFYFYASEIERRYDSHDLEPMHGKDFPWIQAAFRGKNKRKWKELLVIRAVFCHNV